MKNRITMMIAAVAAMFAVASASGADAYWYGEGGTGVGAKGANAWSATALDTSVEGWADSLTTWSGAGKMYVPIADNTINLAGGLTVTTVLNPDTAAKNILFTNGTLSVSQNNGWPASSQQCDNMSFTFAKGAALYLTGSAPRMKLEDGVTMVFTDGATYSEKNGKNDSYYNLIGCEGATSNALVVANGATVTLKSQLRIGAYGDQKASSTGTVHIAGGTLNANNNAHMAVHWSAIANATTSFGCLTVDGGELPGGVGKFRTGTLGFGRNNTAAGTSHAEIHVNEGGVLEVTALNCYGSGTRKFYANGGTVRASANTTTLFNTVSAGYNPTVAEIEAGGLTIDSQNFTVSAAIWPFTGEGAITKVGSGTLTLTAPTSQQGGYIAKEGTLSFSGTAVTVPVVATNGAVVAVTNNATVAGQIVAENDGTVRLENGSTVSGQVVAENGGTVRLENGATISGSINLRDCGAVEIPASVATGGDFVFSRNSILSLLTDTALVPHLTIGSTPLYNPITVKLSGKTPIVKNAPILSVTEGTLVNRASQLPAITIDVSGLSDADALGAEFSVTLSADLKSLLLSVTLANPGNTFSWTGAGDGVNFSDGANWFGGAAPQAGAAVELFFPAPSGAITNDIAGLTPVSITFGREIPDVTIAGEALTGLHAVTNLSTSANVTFTAPVFYADGKIIEVFHAGRYSNAQYNNANGAFVHETGLVIFAGGVTGHDVRSYDSLGNAAKTGSHNIYAGHYTRTNSALYVNAGGYNNETEYGYRPAIYHNSSLAVKNAGQTMHLYMGEGGAFTTGVAHVSAKGHRLSCTILGEYVVTSCVTNSGSGDKYAFYQRPAGKPPVFKIEKIYTTATANWFMLGSQNAASDSTFYIGSGGFQWSSASAVGAICLGDDHSGTVTTLRPWYSDFTIAARGDSTKSLVVRRKAIFCTDDEQGEARKITLDGKIYFVNTDEQIVSGYGTFRVNSTPDPNSVAAPVKVIDSATLEFGPGASLHLLNKQGALSIGENATYSLVDASVSTITNAAMTIAGGATIKIGNLSAARPAIYASGAVTVGDGSSLVLNGEPLADGVYTVIESASAIPLATASAFTLSGTALEGRPALLSLSADGKKLVLTVGASTAFVWTGAGADANFSTPGNWLGGVAPAAGATAPIVFQSGSGTVYNDVGVLKPETITFGTGVSEGFEVAGAYGFENVGSVANMSDAANPKISVPVRFADTINVRQTVAYKKDTQDQNVDYEGKTFVDFAGGAYGTTNGPPQSGWSNVVKGRYFFTDAENYRSPSQADGSLVIGSGSSVCAETIAGSLGEMEIDAGGAFTAGVYRTTVARLTRTNYGEYVITNELVVTLPSNGDIYSHWRWSDGKFKLEKVTLGDSGVNKLFRFANSQGESAYTRHVFVGSGGLNFKEGTQPNTSYCFGERGSSSQWRCYVYPWYSDYEIGTKAGAVRDVAFSQNPVHMMTVDENGVPRTVTLNGIAGNDATVYIDGAGAFIVNSDCTRTGATIVTNGATLAFGPGADFGTGAMTFHAGTTLKFTDGLSTGTTGGALTLPGGDGSVALVIDGETLAEGDYPVYVSSAVLPAGVAGTFLLSGTAIPDPAEKKSTLYVSADGKQLRLLVGNPPLETDDFVWTGAAGDGKFSTPGNWLGNKDIATSTLASKIYISVPSDATLDCDVAVTAGSITFPSGSAKVTLSGSSSLTLNAIANAGSDIHHSFAVPVTITGEAAINVTHSAASYVEFPGGLTGYALPAESGYYKGVLTLTSEAAWGSFNKDIYILGSAEEPTTHVHVKFTQNLSYLNISTNAVFETDVFSHTTGTKWFCRVNDGTLKVGAYTITADNNYPGTSANNVQHYGVIEVDAMTNSAGNASSCWFRFEPGSGNGRPWQKWVIGAGGINYGSGATRTDCGYDISGQATAFFYPKADYALGCSAKNITYGDYRVEANCKFVYSTTDYYTGEPRTVTMNGRFGDAGTIDICGAGTFVVTTNSIHTGGTVVSNMVTLVLANENAVLGTGPLTMYGGTTLAVPLLAGETDPLAIAGTVQYDGEGAVTLKIGDGSALADGTYKVLAAGDAVSGELVSKLSLANSASSATFYTADGGKTLMLSVGAAPVITEYVWSGAAGDGKMNTPGNWLGGAVPGTGAEVFFASGADGTIENDIAGFAPKSITFTEGIGAGLALSGNNISVSGAITNLSTDVSPVINARVDFTGNITVNQKATGHDNRTNSHIVFEGGVHAAADCGNTDPAAGSAALYGHYFADYTEAAGFSPTATGSNRYTVRPDSSLTVENVATLREIDVASGGAVTAGVVRLSNGGKGNDRLAHSNYGEVVITNELVLSASGDKQAVYTEDSNMNGVFKINKVTQNMTANWMYFGCFQGSTHKATRLTFYFGEEGLTFGSSGLASIYSAGADNANSRVTFRPWHTSFKLDRGTGRTAGSELIIHRNATFCTDNEDDEPGRIIVNGRLRAKSAPAITISGSGVFELNESAANDVQPPVTLTDTATLKFGAPDVVLTSGAVTLGAGTTLALPLVADGSSPVALGGTLAFSGEGKVKLVLGDGSKIAEGDWPVFTLVSPMPDATLETFELQNETAAVAKFYSSDGKTLRLLVGESEYSGPSVWTGAAGDGKMNTPGNWLLDKTPAAPGATVYFPSASGEIENDITGFAPKSITFGTEIGDIVISGSAISDVWAVTNLSTTANVTFTAPVAFADQTRMSVYHGGQYNNSNGLFSKTTGMVIFEGGVTAYDLMDNNGSGPHNIYAGHYVRTNPANYTNTRTGNNWRCVVFDNSSLTVENSGDISQILIGNGGAFTTATATVGASFYLSNRGEYVITGQATRNNKNEANTCYNYNATWVAATVGAVIKVGGFTVKGGGSFGLTGGTKNNAYSLTNDWYIGEGGLNTTPGSTSFFFTRNAGDLVRIHPWKNDFAISGGSTTAFDIYPGAGAQNGGSIAFITDDENGVPRTITMNANAKFGCRAVVSNACSLTVGGSGTLRWNSTGSDFYGPTRVTDTATFAFGSSAAKLGTAPVSFDTGTTLAFEGTGDVTVRNEITTAPRVTMALALDGANCTRLVFESSWKDSIKSSGLLFVKPTDASRPALGTEFVLTSNAHLTSADLLENGGFIKLHPDCGGTLSVNSDGELVYRSLGMFFIRICSAEESEPESKVDPTWFTANCGVPYEVFRANPDCLKTEKGANGVTYMASYLMGLDPNDPESGPTLVAESGSEKGEFNVGMDINVQPDESLKVAEGHKLAASAQLLESDNGIDFTPVEDSGSVAVEVGESNKVAFAVSTERLGDREMRFFA